MNEATRTQRLCLSLAAHTAVYFHLLWETEREWDPPRQTTWTHPRFPHHCPALRNAFEVSGKSVFHRRNWVSLLRLKQHLTGLITIKVFYLYLESSQIFLSHTQAEFWTPQNWVASGQAKHFTLTMPFELIVLGVTCVILGFTATSVVSSLWFDG